MPIFLEWDITMPNVYNDRNVLVTLHKWDWCYHFVFPNYFCFCLSEVEFRYISDTNDKMSSAFYGILAPFILSILCILWCAIRWVLLYYTLIMISYFSNSISKTHFFVDWLEIQIGTVIEKIENKTQSAFRK